MPGLTLLRGQQKQREDEVIVEFGGVIGAARVHRLVPNTQAKDPWCHEQIHAHSWACLAAAVR